jgi:hypothetical protein
MRPWELCRRARKVQLRFLLHWRRRDPAPALTRRKEICASCTKDTRLSCAYIGWCANLPSSFLSTPSPFPAPRKRRASRERDGWRERSGRRHEGRTSPLKDPCCIASILARPSASLLRIPAALPNALYVASECDWCSWPGGIADTDRVSDARLASCPSILHKQAPCAHANQKLSHQAA